MNNTMKNNLIKKLGLAAAVILPLEANAGLINYDSLENTGFTPSSECNVGYVEDLDFGKLCLKFSENTGIVDMLVDTTGMTKKIGNYVLYDNSSGFFQGSQIESNTGGDNAGALFINGLGNSIVGQNQNFDNLSGYSIKLSDLVLENLNSQNNFYDSFGLILNFSDFSGDLNRRVITTVDISGLIDNGPVHEVPEGLNTGIALGLSTLGILGLNRRREQGLKLADDRKS